MKLELRGDRIFVIFDEMEKGKKYISKATGQEMELHYPDKHGERSRIATIKSIGGEVNDYKEGDKVLLSWYTGVRVHLIGKKLFGEEVDEDRFRIIREEEILAKVID